MKVLLVNPPQPRDTYVQAPLGLLYIASVLEKHGHEVQVFDCPGLPHNNNISSVIKKISLFQPDIIGLTAMTTFKVEAYNCIKQIRTSFTGKILLGGPHASALGDKIFSECPDVDIVVRGEAENVINDIVLGKLQDKVVNGVSVVDLDSIPCPAWHLVSDNKYMDVFGTTAVMVSSRGCYYNCLFCKSDKNYRCRSPQNVVDEIQAHVNAGRTNIAFYDDNMALHRSRLVAICKEIIYRGIKVSFKMETRVNLVDPELLVLLKEAGCSTIAYGIESSSQDVLDFYCKGITPDLVIKAVKATHDAGIQTVGYFVIGAPIETKEQILDTINFAITLNLDYAQFAILCPLPNTALWEYVVENNLLLTGTPSYFGKTATSIIKHPTLSPKELKALSKLANRKFYFRINFVIKTLRKIKSISDLKSVIRGIRIVLS